MPDSHDKPPPDAALVRAMGGALSILTTLLARQGLLRVSDVSELFGVYAVATSEIDDAEGQILGCWAAMLRDVAQDQAVGSSASAR
ncbi:hypothetical protein [Sphingobium sp. CFD-2]|uniref:hypothetical protein n=1 Tax=Sphingobium sp. CFD-2 TaxID=2878542 RepID=UPI00214B7784|nr:hypothetical protein [Sphingobium sp. CFD-2]